jgi:hypothetical protein
LIETGCFDELNVFGSDYAPTPDLIPDDVTGFGDSENETRCLKKKKKKLKNRPLSSLSPYGTGFSTKEAGVENKENNNGMTRQLEAPNGNGAKLDASANTTNSSSTSAKSNFSFLRLFKRKK